MPKIKVLITGSNGFIGRNLKDELCKISNITVFEFNRGDGDSALEKLIIKSDFIYHLAGEVRPNSEKSAFIESNLNLTKNILDILNRNKISAPILFVSSIHAELSINDYGKTKRESELLIEEYSHHNNDNCFIYRLTHVFGEGCKPNYNSVISTWIYNSINNIEINVFDREINMKYVYVKDLVRDFVYKLENRSDNLYTYPSIVYDTNLGEVVDYIHEFENFFDNNDCTVKSDSFKGKLFQTYCYYHKESIKDGLS